MQSRFPPNRWFGKSGVNVTAGFIFYAFMFALFHYILAMLSGYCYIGDNPSQQLCKYVPVIGLWSLSLASFIIFPFGFCLFLLLLKFSKTFIGIVFVSLIVLSFPILTTAEFIFDYIRSNQHQLK